VTGKVENDPIQALRV